ncbi:MAG: carboxypeptidase regulatory-like domain-containing protein [Planctomycetes bacterium]|nr:carboxypeptidase regulatory-like domain-containing protein [Planctomycetota bacterium]
MDPEFDYALEIIPPASAPTSRRLWLTGWRPDEHAVRLEPAWHLRGVVQNADGSPASYATVYLERRGNEPIEDLRTDEQGRFAFPHLAADSVTLWARPLVGSPQGPRTPARTTNGDVVLRLPTHAGRLEINVRSWPSLPPLEEDATGVLVARYAVWDPNDPARRFSGQPAPDGSVRLDGLESSVRWSVLVNRDDLDLCARMDGLVADGRTYELEAKRAELIHGRVTAPDQTWPHRVEVVETGLSYDIDDDGAYTITGHPPGTWTLRASASKGRNRIYRTVTATGPQAPPIDFAADR